MTDGRDDGHPINEVAIVQSIERLRGDIRELVARVDSFMTTTTRDIHDLQGRAQRNSDVIGKVRDDYVCVKEFNEEKAKRETLTIRVSAISGGITVVGIVINIAIALYSSIGKH